MGDMMGSGYMMGGGLLWGLLALLVVVVLLTAVVALVVPAVRRGTHDYGAQGYSSLASDAATDILRRRYAAGEIDDEEFARRSEVISRH